MVVTPCLFTDTFEQVLPTVFSMKEYSAFVQSIAPEIKSFRDSQAAAVAIEEER